MSCRFAKGPVITAILLSTLLFFAPLAYSVNFDAKVEDISNRQYYNAVISEINNANTSIYVAMYSAYLRLGKIESPAYQLLKSLIDAQQRGVAVKVYMDSNKGNWKGNRAAYQILESAGVDVCFTDAQVKMHAKVILIDNAVVITGSANWTDNAANLNTEHNVILRGAQYAQSQLEFFKELEKIKVTGVNKKAIPTVRVPSKFLQDELMMAAMVHNDAWMPMRLYLKLLYSASPSCYAKATRRQGMASQQQDWVDVNYEETARYLGIKIEKQRSNYRTQVRSVVDDLKTKYGLVDYRAFNRNGLQVRLIDCDGGFFEIPVTFWEYGLDGELKPLEEMAYFICLYETAHNAPKLYWWMGFEAMEQEYHISREKLSKSFVALEKMGLIDVRRYPRDAGKAYDERNANEYRLLPLLSPEDVKRRWAVLNKKYGKDLVAKARTIAASWDKENRLDDVEGIIKLINSYGLAKVQAAMNKVGGYSPNNSARNLVYLEEVIKNL